MRALALVSFLVFPACARVVQSTDAAPVSPTFAQRAEAVCSRAAADYAAEASRLADQVQSTLQDLHGSSDPVRLTATSDRLYASLASNAYPSIMGRMLDALAALRPPNAQQGDLDALVAAGRRYVDLIAKPAPDQSLDPGPAGQEFAARSKALGLRPPCTVALI
ncbi:MAG TPA: hypothetical protein VFJ85_06400 [Acidimicrobiales bacterium]|nr:hypothetical protein [Acidimicrobiales bacterium]